MSSPEAGGAAAAPAGAAGASPRARAEAFGALALLALVWGYSWIPLKIATRDASPVAVATLRSAFGAVALLGVLALMRRPLRPPPFGPTLVYGVLQTAGFTIPQTFAVSLGGAGRGAVLAYTMPFWLALLARAFLGERIGRARGAALALAAVGLWLVGGFGGSRPPLASALAVLSGFFWAASAVWALRTLLRRGHDLLSVTAWQMVWGTFVVAAFGLVLPVHATATVSLVLSIAFLSLGGYALGWVLWAFVLTRLPPNAAGLGALVTPVLSVVLAAIQLGEIPSRGELAGMACVVAALAVNARAAPPSRG